MPFTARFEMAGKAYTEEELEPYRAQEKEYCRQFHEAVDAVEAARGARDALARHKARNAPDG